MVEKKAAVKSDQKAVAAEAKKAVAPEATKAVAPEVKKAAVPEVKKAVAPEVKKAVSPRKATVKKEIKIQTIIEHQGKQVEEKTIVAAVKKAWTKSGKKVGDIKAMDLYIKPEEGSVYYVINAEDTGKVDF